MNKEKELLQFIQEKKNADVRDCMERFGIPRSSMNRMLKNLLDAGLIVREGGSRNAVYFPCGSSQQ